MLPRYPPPNKECKNYEDFIGWIAIFAE